MNGVTNISLGPKYVDKLAMLQALVPGYNLGHILQDIPDDLLEGYEAISLGLLDTKVKNGQGLTFKEAFQGMMLVIAATNNIFRNYLYPTMSYAEAVAKGSYFLTIMAAKEAFVGLTPDEIAGMASAGRLDLFYTPKVSDVIETCGMGADRGWGTKDLKTINVSTLSALTACALGNMAMKHGSYGNTTRVGSTDVLEQFGANVAVYGMDAVNKVFMQTGFWFSDAHAVKTLHYLSHLLMVETVNHIIGPMTAPVHLQSRLYKMMGVNHFVHPSAVAKAYAIMHQHGFVNLGGAVIVGGVDSVPGKDGLESPSWFKSHAYLDEVGPTATLVSLAKGSEYLGTVVLHGDSAFGVSFSEEELKVPNTIPTLMKANVAALRGEGVFARYLASNTGLALMSTVLDQGFDLNQLQRFTEEALTALENFAVLSVLDDYVAGTGGSKIEW